MSDPAIADPEIEDEETSVTEITIAPDGRIFVFGLSRAVVDVLEALRPDDARLQRLVNHMREIER